MRPIDAHALSKVYMMKGKDKLRISTVINELELSPTIYMPKQQWIPVSERLPEKYEDVLITYKIPNEKAARIWIGYRAEKGWCAYGVYRPNITAWMPMPEAYEEETP